MPGPADFDDRLVRRAQITDTNRGPTLTAEFLPEAGTPRIDQTLVYRGAAWRVRSVVRRPDAEFGAVVVAVRAVN